MQHHAHAPAPVTADSLSRCLADRIGHHTYDMWFGDIARLEVHGSCVTVATDNRFAADWIDGHFRDALARAARETLGDGASVDLRVAPRRRRRRGAGPGSSRGARRNGRSAPAARGLADFLVTPCNELACAAAERIAGGDASGSPLFIYGDCGVGKTHLLRGITGEGNAAPAGRGPARYLTAEQFTNEYIAAVREGRLDRFRKRMRGLALLAVDDVQFLAEKSATQKEFLHTVDALALAGARIAVTADRHPLHLNLNRALASRLVAGMVAQIQRPDRAARLKLVERLAGRRGVRLSPAAAEAVAARCIGSVRELEGCVNKLLALRLLCDAPLDAEIGMVLVERLFGDTGFRPAGPVRIGTIVDVVCSRLLVSPADLMGPGRHRRVVTARGLVAYLARELTTMSYPEIARTLGRRHHSTVHGARARVAAQVAEGARLDVGDDGRRAPAITELLDRLRHEILTTARAA